MNLKETQDLLEVVRQELIAHGKLAEDEYEDFPNSCEGYDADEFSYCVTSTLTEGETLSANFELVERFGGEGEGETYYYLFRITTKDEVAYIKYDAYYNSWSGTEWNDVYMVAPKEVMITEYHRI